MEAPAAASSARVLKKKECRSGISKRGERLKINALLYFFAPSEDDQVVAMDHFGRIHAAQNLHNLIGMGTADAAGFSA